MTAAIDSPACQEEFSVIG